MPLRIQHTLWLCFAAGIAAISGCQKHAVFEAEAALRPGAIYTGPDISTFAEPIDSLTLGDIAAELRAMVQANHTFANLADLRANPTQATQLQSIDMAHTDRLGEIIDTIGWPTEKIVGSEAALAAFIITQQSVHDPEFQRQCLWRIQELLKSGLVSTQRFAMLTDRVQIQTRGDQTYGTQVQLCRDGYGKLIAQETAPIVNPDTLDERRQALGLDPWRHYTRRVADTAKRMQSPRLSQSR